VELYETVKSLVGGADFELVLKKPTGKYFYYAFCRFSDIYTGKTFKLVVNSLKARKLIKEIRFPQIQGKVCRALPYDRELKSIDNNTSKASLFIKGLRKDWSHKDLFEYFKPFGEITSVKISLNENHLSRGYGFVLFTREEFAQRALETVIYSTTHNLNLVEWSVVELRLYPQGLKVP